MTNKLNELDFYKGAAIADLCWLAGLNDDLTCDMYHPRNAVYRNPLSDTADEDMANAMADASWGALEEQRGQEPGFDPEATFQQCLVDARRMVVEPEYSRLFCGDGPGSLDEIVSTRSRWSK